MPRISVIIPAYNAERTVGVAVDSVLAQTFRDFEILVIDDGSSDSTAKVVEARPDPRVRCFTIRNGGVARARNKALTMAAGEFVAFLDADDVWYPTKLERQLELMMRQPAVGLCYTAAELVDDNLDQIGHLRADPPADYCSELLTGNIIAAGGSSVMLRASTFAASGGFDPALSQCADWDLWLRLSLQTQFLPVQEPLVRYRKIPGTMSSNPELLQSDTFALLDKFYAMPAAKPYRRWRRRAYSTQWMVCAGTYLHAGRVRESVRCVWKGLTTDPRSVWRPLLLPARWASRLWTEGPRRRLASG